VAQRFVAVVPQMEHSIGVHSVAFSPPDGRFSLSGDMYGILIDLSDSPPRFRPRLNAE